MNGKVFIAWICYVCMGDTVRACCVCDAIEKYGELVPRGAPGNMGDEGYTLSHGILSSGCLEKQYGKEMLEAMDGLKMDADMCPNLEDYLQNL